MTSEYSIKRKQFYKDIEAFWADLYDQEYALYDLAFISKNELEKIHYASKRIGHIFFKAARLLRQAPDQTLLEMGFPKETLHFIRLSSKIPESIISRLDLVAVENTYKCIELNADTPTFIKELFEVNGKVCDHFGFLNPNESMDKTLGSAINSGISQAASELKENKPTIVFTAYEENQEDRETVLYLQKLSGLPSKFVPLNKLVIKKDIGLFDEIGQKIDILYRQTFPIENLILDEDEQGNKIGIWLLDLVKAGKLVILNPPSAFLLQNKAVQAVIWGLHQEKNTFFTSEEHDWIEEYFLPTFLDPDYFIKVNISYVKKPSYGREGDTVEIFSGKGLIEHPAPQLSYTEFLPVYQQFVNMPSIHFKSEKGIQKGHLLIGSFLLNGAPSAIGYRVGERITNNLSYYMPIGIRHGG